MQDSISEGQTPYTRRDFLKGVGAVAGSLLFVKGAFNQEARDAFSIIKNRDAPSYQEGYLPRNPLEIIPNRISDAILADSGLLQECPETINQEAFRVLMPRVAKILSGYYRPDASLDVQGQEDGFYTFVGENMKQLFAYAEYVGVDKVGLLLMWQVSGAANSSLKAMRDDIRDEFVRAGTSIAGVVAGEGAVPHMIKTMRLVGVDAYYAMARLEGPVTVGIHDIETVMIARSIVDFEESYSERWGQTRAYLEKRAPGFFEKYKQYAKAYDQFEEESKRLAVRIGSDEQIRNYVAQFNEPELLKKLMMRGKDVDSYQLSRTTVFWAILSELSVTVPASAYSAREKQLVELAMDKTVEYYHHESKPEGFFLDQINNPRILKWLELDAKRGNETAKKLLVEALQFKERGDAILGMDRDINATMMKEGLENDVPFQLFTGVLYSRWLLSQAEMLETGEQRMGKLNYDNPDRLAWLAFLGNGNRETGPSYQLSATRPLNRASFPFVDPKLMQETMKDFVQTAYTGYSEKPPDEDFRTFVAGMGHIAMDQMVPLFLQANHYELFDLPAKVKALIERAEAWGSARKLITPPHCSWLRALEATAGYIAKIK